ncbi:BCCT family transporter [Desulforhopalus singaporensis]|uniref:Choline-glycine betaine transporter n=1 Tax=Desulforhopalus singaporensis TaxID=91360 RepID=A0A1H0RTT0_9BACT|nr:BCCT family transporter [Desulforhopalus singaporensis]SDP32386.1 Choline-glycine betaine transporter [Desulforhopalus singaporensis]
MDDKTADNKTFGWSTIEWPVFLVSGGGLLLFVILSLVDADFVSGQVNKYFGLSCKYFGAYWQWLLLLNFFIAMALAVSKYGSVRLGGTDVPEMSTFRWVAIIMCTLLAGGGVFWSAAEPMYYFTSPPPAFGAIEAGTTAAVIPAMEQAFLHWGFLAWSILGTLGAVVLMYVHYHKGHPLQARALLYPVFGEKIMTSTLGQLAEGCSILAVAAGTIGPIGFLGLQVSYALNQLFSIPDAYVTQLAIIIALVILYTISAITGIHKGIQLLSRINVLLTVALVALILVIGPGGFIIDTFTQAMGSYVKDFTFLSLFRGDTGWLSWWTVFFWGWFLGYGPLMAVLVARISRGRTIREIMIAVGVIAPLATHFWFTILGGTGIFFELGNAGVISGPLKEAGLPAALLAVVGQLPLSSLLTPVFLALIFIFLATTGDSMSLSMAICVTGQDDPPRSMRVFWAVSMGVAAAILIKMGSGGIGALQSFIVITAVPVGFIMLPTLWGGPKMAKALYDEQEQRMAAAADTVGTMN